MDWMIQKKTWHLGIVEVLCGMSGQHRWETLNRLIELLIEGAWLSDDYVASVGEVRANGKDEDSWHLIFFRF